VNDVGGYVNTMPNTTAMKFASGFEIGSRHSCEFHSLSLPV